MAFKLINAAEARTGAAIMVDGVACIVRTNDFSKTGKHGHAKCRKEAIGINDGKQKVFEMGGHDRLDVPMIKKNKAQLMSISGLNATVMDLESFETFELSVPEDLKDDLKEEDQVEYWDVEGSKIIKRKL
jgi:translation initiation factor 5A